MNGGTGWLRKVLPLAHPKKNASRQKMDSKSNRAMRSWTYMNQIISFFPMKN